MTAEDEKMAQNAANLADALRALHRNTQPHWSPRGDELRSLLMTQDRAAVLVDAADALEREHERRLTLQHHAADMSEALRLMTADRDRIQAAHDHMARAWRADRDERDALAARLAEIDPAEGCAA